MVLSNINSNMDDIKIDEEDIDVDEDDISIIPEPNYALITDIDRSDNNSGYHNGRMSQTYKKYGLSLPCIEGEIVNEVRASIRGRENVLEVEHTGEHIIVRYESTSTRYFEVAQNLVSKIRSIRNSRSISEEYKDQNGRIEDRVGSDDENLRYIY